MIELNLAHFDGVAFDMEGTLADTVPTHHRTRMQAFEQHGFGHITREQHELSSQYGSTYYSILGGLLYAAGEIDNKIPFEDNEIVRSVVATKLGLFRSAAEAGFDAMPGAVDFVGAIAPHFAGKMAIVTSAAEEFVFPFIERHGLGEYFPEDHVVAHESVVAKGWSVKPSGDPYLLGMQRLKANNILVFEDTALGAASAKKAGATVIALGFDAQNSRLLRSSQLEYPPDAVVGSYGEAASLLGINI